MELVRPTGGGGARTRLALVDTSGGGVRSLDERRANGPLLWSADGRWFAYRREAEGGFELVLCRLQGPRCRPTAVRWERDLVPLALLTAHGKEKR